MGEDVSCQTRKFSAAILKGRAAMTIDTVRQEKARSDSDQRL